MKMSRLAVVLLSAVMFVGCGAHRMSPVDPRPVGNLTALIEDADAGLVGIAPGFLFKDYSAIVLQPLKVASTEIKDDEDARLAKDMSAYFHNQLLTKLRAAGMSTKVIDAGASSPAAIEGRALRLEGDITKLTEGSQAMRYFVGFGAGAAKAQIETRFVDSESRAVQLITADRRAAGMGIFGGDGRQFVTESMDQMADGLAKLLKRLATGGQPGSR